MIEKYLIKNELTLKRWKRFKRRRTAVVGLAGLAVLIFLSLTAELWANNKPILFKFQGELYAPVYSTYHPSTFGQEGFVTDYRALTQNLSEDDWALWPPVRWDAFESNNDVESYPAPPSDQNLFGTDDRGRDILTRLLYGFRYSFGYAFITWFLSYLIGIVAGAIMGFFGGRVDLFGQRVVEVFSTLPYLLLLIILVSIFGASLTLLVVISSFLGWMPISYYVRAEFLKLRNREYVEATRSMGGGRTRMIFKHILPNGLGPVITFTPFVVSGAIASLAALDYLGFGLPAPTPSWGELLQQAQKNFTTAWWLAVFPSLALFISLVVMNLIGEGVRDAMDPRK